MPKCYFYFYPYYYFAQISRMLKYLMSVTNFDTRQIRQINLSTGYIVRKIIPFNYQRLAKHPRVGGYVIGSRNITSAFYVVTIPWNVFLAQRITLMRERYNIAHNPVKFNCPIKRSSMRFIGYISYTARTFIAPTVAPRALITLTERPKYIGGKHLSCLSRKYFKCPLGYTFPAIESDDEIIFSSQLRETYFLAHRYTFERFCRPSLSLSLVHNVDLSHPF